ncbi:MAG: thioredoxin domain-containing protein [Cyanobacteria bacterium REEB67]|nr:thioredoxin domain-containing protein [Cyanobacteria bacterium REEB67]
MTKKNDGSTKASDFKNRLANESSTYLKQHAENPVDWYPWGEEALNKARNENRPILLSVGYSACHWCHVMAHESFEDEETAALMNKHFVNIKVDREERTDIDEIYMKAVQLMVGHGGWPMTVFLTPEGKPFFGGTYFPIEDRHGLPGFKKVLTNVFAAWENNNEEVLNSAGELSAHLKLLEKLRDDDAPRSEKVLGYDIIDGALEKLIRQFDKTFGGFGSAPKFPHTLSLEAAQRVIAHDGDGAFSAERQQQCRELVETTLNRMAYGGIHDQIGGGFARYSVDRQWLVPHFEKMLYDNALLVSVYVNGYLLYGRTYWQGVAEAVLKFVGRELTTEDGAFYSALDADSEGEEGKYYVFTPDEVIGVLGEADGIFFNRVMGVTNTGNFEHGKSILHLSQAPEEMAKRFKLGIDEYWEKIENLGGKLLAEREKRIHPGRDEKVLTSWNSLMISAFVDVYKCTTKVEYLDAAKKAANFILDNLREKTGAGRLLRVWGKNAQGEGQAKLLGYLDDYAYFISALIALAEVDADSKWLNIAGDLTDKMLEYFVDQREGGFFFTASDHEELVVRPRSHFDGSVPSGTSVALMALFKLAALTAKDTYEKQALAVLNLYAEHLSRMPDQFAGLLNALDFHLSTGPQVAFVLPANLSAVEEEEAKEMLFCLHRLYQPNRVLLVVREEAPGAKNAAGSTFEPLAKISPLAAERTAIDGKPTVYICKNFTCEKPITDLNDLKAALTLN